MKTKKQTNFKILLSFLFIFVFVLIFTNFTQAGYDCSYTSVSKDIPEGTNDSQCIDEYYQCQDNNAAIAKEWGNCSGWGGDEPGCHAYTREAWLINPTLCPADYKTQKSFQDDYFWGKANYKYCECVEACGPQPVAKDCWPTLEKCCATLVQEEEPETTEEIIDTEIKKGEEKIITPDNTNIPKKDKPPIDCPDRSTYQNDRCVCDSGYKPNKNETCCAKELSASARLVKLQNLYYSNIPKGIASSGKTNNILSLFDSKYEKYTCGGYQSMILDFLDNIKYSDDCDTSAILEGYDYGPIEAYYKWHQAVVIYPKNTEWTKTGLVLDPWPNQKPEIYTINDWAIKFSGSSFWGIRGSSAYNDGYPTIGGNYINPKTKSIKSNEVKNFLNSLPAEKQKLFKSLSQYEKRSYMYWLKEKSKIRVHIQSPVKVLVTDKKGNTVGESSNETFNNDSDEIYIRTEQMEDGHYAYDIYMPDGNYEIDLTGTGNGPVQVVASLFNQKEEKFVVLQSNFDIKKDENVIIKASSDKNRIESKDIEFEVVKNPEDIKNIPQTNQTALTEDLDSWFSNNWSEYFKEDKGESSIPMWIWIIYGLAVLVFISAIFISIILLILKKKFIIVFLIFMFFSLISCLLFGAGTWRLITNFDFNNISDYFEQAGFATEKNSFIPKAPDLETPEPEPIDFEDTNSDSNEIEEEKAIEKSKTEEKKEIKPQNYAEQGLVLNEDYNFTLDVGIEYADKFTVVEIPSEDFSQKSYVYCFDTIEENEEVIYCDPGEFSLFSVDIMTQEQWSNLFAEDYSTTPFDMGYDVMTDKNGLLYVFSHPNGFLPSDAPDSVDFFDNVKTSIKFINN